MTGTMQARLPTTPSRLAALFLSFVVGSSSIAVLLTEISEPQLAAWFGLGLAGLLGLTMPLFRWAPIYLLRFGLLAAPGMATGLLLGLGPAGTQISSHAIQYQTPRMGAMVLHLTLVALSASAAGWALAVRPVPVRRREEPTKRRFLGYAVVALIGGVLTSSSAGGFVWRDAYTSGVTTPLLSIGVYPVLAVIGVLGMYVGLKQRPDLPNWTRPTFWTITIFVLFFCMVLRGTRLEALAAVTAMLVIRQDLSARGPRPMVMAGAAILLFVFAQAWGSYRFLASGGGSLTDSFKSGIYDLLAPRGGNEYSLGTAGDVAATLYNVIGLTADHLLAHANGRTYADFVPRTLPAFLSPGRPEDPAWLFVNMGQTSGGSFSEITEAYYNFGLIGCMLVPFAISWALGRLYVRVCPQPRGVALMAFAVIVSLLPRGIWYQTFAIYKGMLTWLVVEFGIWISEKALTTLPSYATNSTTRFGGSSGDE